VKCKVFPGLYPGNASAFHGAGNLAGGSGGRFCYCKIWVYIIPYESMDYKKQLQWNWNQQKSSPNHEFLLTNPYPWCKIHTKLNKMLFLYLLP
jgi:hypothetical protein